jgi:hypothetical protein
VTKACTIDVNFIFALNDVKQEITRKICKNFLKNIEKLNIEFVTFESVKVVYFDTMKDNLNVLKSFLRELYKNIKTIKNLTNEQFVDEIRKLFQRYRTDGTLGKKREWVRIFETHINSRIQSKDIKQTDFIPEILHEMQTILRTFEFISNSCFGLIESKSKDHIMIVPKQNLITEASNVIGDPEDCRHIASIFEYGVTEDRWVFFVSLDERHIISPTQVTKIMNKFKIIIPIEPNYAVISIRQFNIGESPIVHFKKLGNSDISDLNNLTQLLGIQLIENEKQ